MKVTKAMFNKDGERKKVTYQYDDGRTVVHEGGSRSWRNNNPGNVSGAVDRRIGKDDKGMDIYPDVQTGEESCRRMFEPSGKYHNYSSVRQVLAGKQDKGGKYINATGYAPACDGNDPDGYAKEIKKITGIDVYNKKIADLTPGEKAALMDAIKQKEGWRIGHILAYDTSGKFADNYMPGSNDPQGPEGDYYDHPGFTVGP